MIISTRFKKTAWRQTLSIANSIAGRPINHVALPSPKLKTQTYFKNQSREDLASVVSNTQLPSVRMSNGVKGGRSLRCGVAGWLMCTCEWRVVEAL